MRFRLVRRAKGVPRRLRPAPPPETRPVVPKAAELENPYGRYYGTARSFGDLKKE